MIRITYNPPTPEKDERAMYTVHVDGVVRYFIYEIHRYHIIVDSEDEEPREVCLSVGETIEWVKNKYKEHIVSCEFMNMKVTVQYKHSKGPSAAGTESQSAEAWTEATMQSERMYWNPNFNPFDSIYPPNHLDCKDRSGTGSIDHKKREREADYQRWKHSSPFQRNSVYYKAYTEDDMKAAYDEAEEAERAYNRFHTIDLERLLALRELELRRDYYHYVVRHINIVREQNRQAKQYVYYDPVTGTYKRM